MLCLLDASAMPVQIGAVCMYYTMCMYRFVHDFSKSMLPCDNMASLMLHGKPLLRTTHELIVPSLVAPVGTLHSRATVDTGLPWGIRDAHGMLLTFNFIF